MAEHQSDRAVALDGRVGVALDADDTSATGSSDAPWIYVSASHDVLPEMQRIALDDDLRQLMQAFVEGGASLCREITQDLLARAPDRSESTDGGRDLHIRLHGLGLEPKDEEELARLIRLVVVDRLLGGEVHR